MDSYIHQATYGEKDSGHRLLNHSFDDSKIPSSILLKTDLPADHFSTVAWDPFYSGFVEESYYVITKTFPDLEAKRSDFVFTHALFINSELIKKIDDIKIFFDLIPNKIDKEAVLSPIKLTEIVEFEDELIIDDRVKKAAYGLVHEDSPIVWLGHSGFINAIRVFWKNIFWKERYDFQFRLSFGPKDIKRSDLKMVLSPAGLKDKWEKYFVIKLDDIFNGELNGPTKILTFGIESTPKIKGLFEELEVHTAPLKNFKKYHRLQTFINNNTAESLKYAVALVNELSPNDKKGIDFKKNLIDKLDSKLNQNSLMDVLSLRNISFTSFSHFGTIKSSCKKIVENNFFRDDNIKQCLNLLRSVDDNKVKDWWRETVRNTIKNLFDEWKDEHSNFFWHAIGYDKDAIGLLESHIPDDNKTEESLIQACPNNEDEQLIEFVISFAKKKEWFKLHAHLLTLIKSPHEALNNQIKVDQNKNYLDGFEVIASKIDKEKFVAFSTSRSDKRLIKISIQLVKDNPQLLNNINVSNHSWLTIWEETLTASTFKQLKNSQDKVYNLLDQLLNGTEISDTLLNSVSTISKLSLLEYPRREEVWKHLPDEAKDTFLDTTSKDFIYQYFSGSKEPIPEKELKNAITSKKRIKKVLTSSKYEANNVINFFDDFEIYNEELIIFFLRDKKLVLDERQCQRIGRIINDKKMDRAYRLVKNSLIDSNKSFKEILKVCRGSFPFIDHDYLGVLSNIFSSKPQKIKSGEFEKTESTVRDNIVLILTAIKVEFNAVKGFLNEYHEEKHPKTGTRYGAGKYGKGWHVKIVETEAGNHNAAIEAQRAIEFYNPDYVFFVGIAGGIKDVDIGDIVVASKVYGYESGKADEEYKPRFAFGKPTYRLKEQAKSLVRDKKWLKKLNQLVSEQLGKNLSIDAFLKPIAAGEKVISSTKSETFDLIKQNASDSLAVEMEGIGFLEACYAYDEIEYLLIRGISDLIDNKSKTDSEGGQELASLTAAAFAFEILSRYKE